MQKIKTPAGNKLYFILVQLPSEGTWDTLHQNEPWTKGKILKYFKFFFLSSEFINIESHIELHKTGFLQQDTAGHKKIEQIELDLRIRSILMASVLRLDQDLKLFWTHQLSTKLVFSISSKQGSKFKLKTFISV